MQSSCSFDMKYLPQDAVLGASPSSVSCYPRTLRRHSVPHFFFLKKKGGGLYLNSFPGLKLEWYTEGLANCEPAHENHSIPAGSPKKRSHSSMESQ